MAQANALWRPPLDTAPAFFSFLVLTKFSSKPRAARDRSCVCVSVLWTLLTERKYLCNEIKIIFFLKEGCDSFFFSPHPIEHCISGLSLVIAIFSFRVGYSSVCVSVCLCLTSWGLFGLVDGVFCCSVWWFCLPVKEEEGRRAFDSIQAQQVNSKKKKAGCF